MGSNISAHGSHFGNVFECKWSLWPEEPCLFFCFVLFFLTVETVRKIEYIKDSPYSRVLMLLKYHILITMKHTFAYITPTSKHTYCDCVVCISLWLTHTHTHSSRTHWPEAETTCATRSSIMHQ